MTTSALNFPFAFEERDGFSSDDSSQNSLRYEQLFQLILACNFEGLLIEYVGHPLINFLKETKCQNFAMFLEVFIRYQIKIV